MGYESPDDLRDDFSGRTGEVVDGGDRGAPQPKNSGGDITSARVWDVRRGP